jgi:uncharacterized protein (TIGR01777 family)
MRIVVGGSTGFIGRILCRRLIGHGHQVVALSRSRSHGRSVFGDPVDVVEWDARSARALTEILRGADAMVNLVGENIGAARWSVEQKQRILDSRVDAAQAVVAAAAGLPNGLKVFVQGSAIGYYGHHGDENIEESCGVGDGFLADVIRQVEAAASQIQSRSIRLVLARTGVVLGSDGGMLRRMVRPFQFFAGGTVGSGRQWIPWIHTEDEVDAIRFLLERDDLEGPFNLTAPEPVRMREFCNAIGRTIGRPSWLRVPAFALLALFGEMADEVMLGGARVVPKRLLDAGFEFRYRDVQTALDQILGQKTITESTEEDPIRR